MIDSIMTSAFDQTAGMILALPQLTEDHKKSFAELRLNVALFNEKLRISRLGWKIRAFAGLRTSGNFIFLDIVIEYKTASLIQKGLEPLIVGLALECLLLVGGDVHDYAVDCLKTAGLGKRGIDQ